MAGRRRLLRLAACALGALVVVAAGGLAWLGVDASRNRDAWFAERHGELESVERESLQTAPHLAAERVRLTSTSGLAVTLRVLRPRAQPAPLPAIMLLGGHQTGADAVELFDDVSERIVVALDYPYDGPLETRTLLTTLGAVPAIRRAFLDAAPAIWLATDWLLAQDWLAKDRLALAGVSLGVPFAATAAARDERIAALLLVHGAADNRAWVARNIERRADFGPLLPPAATVANWLVYGPLHDTAANVARMAPRPVVIVGARDDERVPAGQTQALYAAARAPKTLRWTDGLHVQTGRRDVVDELMAIADEELDAMLGTGGDGAP